MKEVLKVMLLALTVAVLAPAACSGEKSAGTPTAAETAARAATDSAEADADAEQAAAELAEEVEDVRQSAAELADEAADAAAGEDMAAQAGDEPKQASAETTAAEAAPAEPVKVAQAESAADKPAPAKANAGPAPYRAGDHYSTLTPVQPTGAPPGKIEIFEAFMYTCPHCYNFEPYIDKWLASKPDYVQFVRVPALFNRAARIHARAYYTAETLGILDQVHMPFFRELHVNRKPMTEQQDIAAFFEGFGIDQETFNRTFNSFAVDTRLRRAESLNRRYRISSTPMLVVNGKYLTNGDKITSYAQLLEIAEYLAAKEAGRL